MAQIKGWTLVLVWFTAAFAIWFLASISPGVNVWLKDQQHLAGWAQAVGAIIAIFGAYLLGERQAAHARKLVAEQQLVDGARMMQSIRKILEHTNYQLKMFREAWWLRGQAFSTIHECTRMKAVIDKIDLVKCNSPALVELLLQIPPYLDEAIEYQNALFRRYNDAVVARRTEPGRREIFNREVNGTQAIENFIDLAIEQAIKDENDINAMRVLLP
jgi:hypothetical protein